MTHEVVISQSTWDLEELLVFEKLVFLPQQSQVWCDRLSYQIYFSPFSNKKAIYNFLNTLTREYLVNDTSFDYLHFGYETFPPSYVAWEGYCIKAPDNVARIKGLG